MKRELNAEAKQYFRRANSRHQMDFLHVGRSRGVFHVEDVSKVGGDGKTTTKNRKHNVFYNQFRPMIFVLTAFGRISIQRSSNGQ